MVALPASMAQTCDATRTENELSLAGHYRLDLARSRAGGRFLGQPLHSVATHGALHRDRWPTIRLARWRLTIASAYGATRPAPYTTYTSSETRICLKYKESE